MAVALLPLPFPEPALLPVLAFPELLLFVGVSLVAAVELLVDCCVEVFVAVFCWLDVLLLPLTEPPSPASPPSPPGPPAPEAQVVPVPEPVAVPPVPASPVPLPRTPTPAPPTPGPPTAVPLPLAAWRQFASPLSP